MTEQEYTDKLKDLGKKHRLNKRALYRDFAFANSSIEIGDIIHDRRGPIKVDQIGWVIDFGSGMPECVYNGVRYTKGRPFKNGERRQIWQQCLTEAK